jgi:hypothetical protein
MVAMVDTVNPKGLPDMPQYVGAMMNQTNGKYNQIYAIFEGI